VEYKEFGSLLIIDCTNPVNILSFYYKQYVKADHFFNTAEKCSQIVNLITYTLFLPRKIRQRQLKNILNMPNLGKENLNLSGH
jgi:hypothetical protein